MLFLWVFSELVLFSIKKDIYASLCATYLQFSLMKHVYRDLKEINDTRCLQKIIELYFFFSPLKYIAPSCPRRFLRCEIFKYKTALTQPTTDSRISFSDPSLFHSTLIIANCVSFHTNNPTSLNRYTFKIPSFPIHTLFSVIFPFDKVLLENFQDVAQ